jgi:hypothetical protein
MSEIYQVVFNSQGSNVINNANRNAVIYNVNWGSFLPKKFKKFHAQFVFKSANFQSTAQTPTILSDNGFVNMNIGKIYCNDGLGQTNNIGVVYPVLDYYAQGNLTNATTTNTNFTAPTGNSGTITNTFANSIAVSYYTSTNNDNNEFWIDYPTNQQITITLNTFAGVAMANMPHYVLNLSLRGILDDELDLKN